jgi:hypothetical protein
MEKIISTVYFPFDLVQNSPALPIYWANIAATPTLKESN